jgi:mercuric ion transport protein
LNPARNFESTNESRTEIWEQLFLSGGRVMRREKLAGAGALLAAGVGSVCCVGPTILAGLGFGAGAVSFARALDVLNLPMTVAALSLLGAAFFLKFRKKTVCAEGNACCGEMVPGKTSKSSIFLWTVASLTMVLLLIPYLL